MASHAISGRHVKFIGLMWLGIDRKVVRQSFGKTTTKSTMPFQDFMDHLDPAGGSPLSRVIIVSSQLPAGNSQNLRLLQPFETCVFFLFHQNKAGKTTIYKAGNVQVYDVRIPEIPTFSRVSFGKPGFPG